MGGLLFKKGRISSEKYYSLVQELKDTYLVPKFGENNFNIPANIKDKKDFGDVDINLNGTIIKPNWNTFREEIIKDFNLKDNEYKIIKSVLSTVYKDFQVDYFARSAETFQSAYNFQSYNSLGNMIGKIVKRLEMKFTEKGLYFVYRRENGKDDHYKSELLLSRNMSDICNFLSLDYDKWTEGFTYNELFEWFVNTKFLYVDPFIKLNDENVRPTMLKFKHFLLQNKIQNKNSIINLHYNDKIKELIPLVLKHFNVNILDFIEKEQEKEETAKILKEKFNGKIIMELTNLKGKELGLFIQKFKYKFMSEDEFKKFIIESNKEEIKNKIVSIFSKSI